MAQPIKALTNYFRASIQELKKVAWPTKAETVRYSTLVIGITLAVAIAIGVLDFALTAGLKALISTTPAPTVQVEQPAQNTALPDIQFEPVDIQSEGGATDDIQFEAAPVEE